MNQLFTDLRYFEETVNVGKLKALLDGKNHLGAVGISERITAMKWLLAMISKGRDMSVFYADVVKNVVVKSVELKKLVYMFLIHYTDHNQHCRELALLSVNSFQKDMADSNPLIRALALRTLTSIRVVDIVHIQMMAVQQCASDPSPYVRKITAHALLKIYTLDPHDHYNTLLLLLQKLLKDSSLVVVSSALRAFQEICPERIDLIHPCFHSFCRSLVDLDEWGQITLIDILSRYCRQAFIKPPTSTSPLHERDRVQFHTITHAPPKPLPTAKDLQSFYADDDDTAELLPSSAEPPPESQTSPLLPDDSFTGTSLDPIPSSSAEPAETTPSPREMSDDHKLLLRSALPLLKSRNAGVVVAVCSLLWHCGQRSPGALSKVSAALARLVRSHREVQHSALKICLYIARHEGTHLAPFLPYFFVDAFADASFARQTKLQLLVSLANSDNIDLILLEMESYMCHPSKSFVKCAMDAVGQLALKLPKVSERCLRGLLTLTTSSYEEVVSQAVVVIRRLVEADPAQIGIVKRVLLLLDELSSPSARAALVWIASHFIEDIKEAAPELLRKLARRFVDEKPPVKIQIVHLALRVRGQSFASAPSGVHELVKYVVDMARFDLDVDIRDRARMFASAVSQENGEEQLAWFAWKRGGVGGALDTGESKGALHSLKNAEEGFHIGSMAQLLGRPARGFKPLPEWAEEPIDARLRSVTVESEVDVKSHLIQPGQQPTSNDTPDIDLFYRSHSSSSSSSSSSESSSSSSGQSDSSSDSESQDKLSNGASKQGTELAGLFDPGTSVRSTSKLSVLSHVHAQGLQVEASFPRSSMDPLWTRLDLTLTNRRSIPLAGLSVQSPSSSYPKLQPFTPIATVPPSKEVITHVLINCGGQWGQPLRLEFRTDQGVFPAQVQLPIGELLRPSVLTVSSFDELKRTTLGGMHEAYRIISATSKNAAALATKLQQGANVQAVAQREPWPLRFVGALPGEKGAIVLITMDTSRITVNSEDPMLANRLIEELRELF